MPPTTLTDTPDEHSPTGAAQPGLTLVYSNGLARAGEQVVLGGRTALLIGREGAFLPGGPLDDARMSGRHAALALDRGRWLLADRGSKNGTFVNGQRVTDQVLAAGDVLRFGSTFLVFGLVAAKTTAGAPVGVSSVSAGVASALVGVGAAMAAVRESATLVAKSDHTVLLLGETGTGKEVVARELHRQSGRAGPFLAVNCASLRGELLESELFGHVRGAFTGAQKSHDGLFLRASAGTVLLDEAGELDEAVQARLLRVLETRCIRPVGASEELAVGTRIIAATNRDAEAAVRAGRLRADLYARLARWAILLPPLRDRLEDLGVLVRAVLAREAPGLDLTPELMAALLSARWPLNVRGLVNVLTTARIAQPNASQLDLAPQVQAALAAQASLEGPTTVEQDGPGDKERVPLQATRVEEVLRQHQGNLAAVARVLELSRPSLYRLLERLGINPDAFRG